MSADERAADQESFNLVFKALTCGVGGCVEWDPDALDRVRKDKFLQGLTPEGITEDLIQHVTNEGDAAIRQVRETRPDWQHREYYYKIIVPYPDLFRKGLFVEMELFIPDPDYPVVHLVNAHEQH